VLNVTRLLARQLKHNQRSKETLMKSALLIFALVGTTVFAQGVSNSSNLSDLTVDVVRNQLGAGVPAPMITVGTETAVYVDDGYYHIPQYLPNHPTAGTIWPRVVEVECDKVDGKIVCEGYHWLPKLGRAEYIMILPRMKAIAPVPKAAPPIIVYREVPAKKKPE
jgi:hypothetical protein